LAPTTGNEALNNQILLFTMQADTNSEGIHHTLLLLVFTIGFPQVKEALSWAQDDIEQEAK